MIKRVRIFWDADELALMAAKFGPRNEAEKPRTMKELRELLLEVQLDLPIHRRRAFTSPSTLYDTSRTFLSIYAAQKEKAAKELEVKIEELVATTSPQKASPKVEDFSVGHYVPTLTGRDKPYGQTQKLKAIIPSPMVREKVEIPASKIIEDKLRAMMPELVDAISSKILTQFTELVSKQDQQLAQLSQLRAEVEGMMDVLTRPEGQSQAMELPLTAAPLHQPKRKPSVLIFGVNHALQPNYQSKHPHLKIETSTDPDIRGIMGYDHMIVLEGAMSKPHKEKVLGRRGGKQVMVLLGTNDAVHEHLKSLG